MPTFQKAERLKSLKIITNLFKEGNSFAVFPLRVVWLPLDVVQNCPFQIQFAASVPRKTFKTAAQRNRLKRRIREAYRLHKNFTYQQLAQFCPDKQYAIMLLFTAKEELPHKIIDNALKLALKRFIKEVKKC